MSTISDGIAALPKATKGPWILGGSYTIRTVLNSTDWICRTRDRLHKHSDAEDSANAIVLAAAPDALAWIKETLYWMETRKKELTVLLEDDNNIQPGELEELTTLTALIARAKPEVEHVES